MKANEVKLNSDDSNSIAPEGYYVDSKTWHIPGNEWYRIAEAIRDMGGPSDIIIQKMKISKNTTLTLDYWSKIPYLAKKKAT